MSEYTYLAQIRTLGVLASTTALILETTSIVQYARELHDTHTSTSYSKLDGACIPCRTVMIWRCCTRQKCDVRKVATTLGEIDGAGR